MPGIHRKRKRRPVTTDEYGRMLARMLNAYGDRIAQDPAAGLGHLRELETALTDAANLGIYTANRDGGKSYNELARILDVSKAAIIKRAQLGAQIADRRDRPAAITARRAQPRQLPPGTPGP